MLFDEEVKATKLPQSNTFIFKGVSQITTFHQSFREKHNIHHGILLPSIYSHFPLLIDDLLFSFSGTNFEKYELKPNENGNILMEDISQCLEFCQKTSFLSKKVIIIHGVSSLSLNVANALLKMLEEPPKDTFFFLIFNTKELVLPTIKSRTLLIEFNNGGDNFNFLYENFISCNISKEEILKITGGQINLLYLFTEGEAKNVIESFNSILQNFSYLSFKKFFTTFNKLEIFKTLIYLLIESKIKDEKAGDLYSYFIKYKKSTESYNTSLELFLYSIISKTCKLN
jgi:DNA polymerase-3 subunit delta'